MYGDSEYMKQRQKQETEWFDRHMKEVRAEKERLEREGESDEVKQRQEEHGQAFLKGINSQEIRRVHTSL